MSSDPILWRLPRLFKAAGIDPGVPVPDLPVCGVTDDSRAVKPGMLFVAVQGTQVDGHRFLSQAVERGARIVLMEQDYPVPPSVVKLRVKETQPLLGPLAHAFLGAPTKTLHVIGVTGTNGKTTVVWLTRHLLECAGISCGLIGTICHQVGAQEFPSGNTTPGGVALQTMFSQMLAQGQKACAMEVSSHALDQYRTDGIEWTCAVFTNLTPEHLDYHGTVENYLRAKLRLFENLGPNAIAMINRDDPAWERVRAAARGPVRTFGLEGPADFSAGKIHCTLEETVCEIRTPEGTFPAAMGLIGRHNVQNLLAALGAAAAVGLPVKTALEGLASFPGVPGRLERIETGQPFPIFVDYAHTDGALRPILQQLRAVTKRKILTVFGCGGDRDRTKRPRMGAVAAELSDRVIITSDNPRSEDPWAIAQEAAAGVQGFSIPCSVVLDRREAIQLALESADENWLVLIAGKGHETGQIIGKKRFPFDDRAVVRELLGEQVAHG